MDSQSHPSASDKLAATCGGQGKMKRKNSHLLHNLTWSAFCQAVSECLDLELEEAYFARDCNISKRLNELPQESERPVLPQESEQPVSNSASVGEVSCRISDEAANDFCSGTNENFFKLEEAYFAGDCSISKKLKFLKRWMKQVRKHSTCSPRMAESTIPNRDVEKQINHRLNELPQESQQPVSNSASMGEVSSRISDEAANDFCSERLVNSSIYWLCQKHKMENGLEGQTHFVKSDDACPSTVAVELADFYRRSQRSWLPCTKRGVYPTRHLFWDLVNLLQLICSFYSSLRLVVGFLLILEVGRIIEELLKQKFVKQITLLLESIQCHLDGGFFGDWQLDDYVGKIIKSRYHHTLLDVVDRIYTKMDLFLFAEDEIPSYPFNSEDSNQSQREKQEKNQMYDNFRLNEPVLVESEPLQQQKHDKRSLQETRAEEHARKLLEVKKRRERGRRFSYFTSSMPDLQRVWAPKQPMAMKLKSDLQKLLKRKDCERESYDTVCEIPVTARKPSSPCGNSMDDEYCHDSGTPSYGTVHKAFFQDDL
ncbi:hypothetical protein SLEP1_g39977 [Rubroshorea leprosula]|uniref:Treslin N-terminal domain-containing protein n=1 Tax=Rubroshorea leprosula TaxID=152421 RepID=A0AAV5L204_9ROSI|nr:hypothetical protein SLEP1_g39977 [Rubroshorea leprosula]